MTETVADKTTIALGAHKLGRDDKAIEVIELASSDVSAAASGFASNTAKYHSVLAMEAARKMRRTRQKKKTGQEVCHHLKMMLSTEPVSEAAAPAEGQYKLAI